MKAAISYLFHNGSLAVLIVAGTIYDVAWALNVSGFIVILGGVIYTLILFVPIKDENLKKYEKKISKRGKHYPALDTTFDLVIACIFAGNGNWVLAIFAALLMLGSASLIARATKGESQ